MAAEAGFSGPIKALSDDMLIYHLKKPDSDCHSAITGLKKDHEEYFKTALLRARGVIKDKITRAAVLLLV